MFGQLQIIDIVQGNKCIYVHPKDLKRKTLVKTLIKRIGEVVPIDFLLYLGEEAMNEPAFQYLNQQKRDGF